jgi:hypothetical protein
MLQSVSKRYSGILLNSSTSTWACQSTCQSGGDLLRSRSGGGHSGGTRSHGDDTHNSTEEHADATEPTTNTDRYRAERTDPHRPDRAAPCEELRAEGNTEPEEECGDNDDLPPLVYDSDSDDEDGYAPK